MRLLTPLLFTAVAAALPSMDRCRTQSCRDDRAVKNSRATWGDYDLDTNFYDVIPDTGVTREYWFDIVNTTAAPDGIERQVLLVNGQFPGPTIEADWGDTIKVHVANRMQNNGTAIHFHGVRQHFTNQMDGVQSLTQCPIPPGSNYTYIWKAAQYGTSWYHSHFSLQAWEGVFGGIVIHGPASADYDEDLGVLFLNDWSHQTADQLYQSQLESILTPQLQGGLLNGTNTWQDEHGHTFGERFQATLFPGKRYRIRLVNAAIHTHFKFSIDGHMMTVIANDFVPILPFEAQYLAIGMGQRYDVIVQAGQPVDCYWMRAVPQTFCSNNTAGENIKGIVRYAGSKCKREPESLKWDYSDDYQCFDMPTSTLVPWLQLNASIQGAQIESTPVSLMAAGSAPVYLWTMGGKAFSVKWDDPTLLQAPRANVNASWTGQAATFELDQPDQWAVFVIQTYIPASHPIHLHGESMNSNSAVFVLMCFRT